MEDDLIAEIRKCSPTGPYSLMHLQHVFEGYRAAVIAGGHDRLGTYYDGVPVSPYHRGGARDLSWRTGVAFAVKDTGGPSDMSHPSYDAFLGR